MKKHNIDKVGILYSNHAALEQGVDLEAAAKDLYQWMKKHGLDYFHGSFGISEADGQLYFYANTTIRVTEKEEVGG